MTSSTENAAITYLPQQKKALLEATHEIITKDRHGIIFNMEMGLGKTFATVALLQNYTKNTQHIRQH